jgi:hypothetical protein
MAKRKKQARRSDFQGLILPRQGESLKALWTAFERGATWYRTGKKRKKAMRLRHTAYKGKLSLEWWGQAIRYVVEDGDGSGKISGAFLGHAQRHGAQAVDWMDIRFL